MHPTLKEVKRIFKDHQLDPNTATKEFYYRYADKEAPYVYNHNLLKKDYKKYVAMTNDQFIEEISRILHFAVFVCFLKNKGNKELGDQGLIHMLVHLSLPGPRACMRIDVVRKRFNTICKIN